MTQRVCLHQRQKIMLSFALFSVFDLFPLHITPSSRPLIFSHQTVTLGYQSLTSGSVVSGFAWRRVSRQTSAVSKEKHTHTHMSCKLNKDKNQKKRTKGGGETPTFPKLPPNPALPASLPSAPLLCLQRSHQRAKKEMRRRRSSGQELRSQRLE